MLLRRKARIDAGGVTVCVQWNHDDVDEEKFPATSISFETPGMPTVEQRVWIKDAKRRHYTPCVHATLESPLVCTDKRVFLLLEETTEVHESRVAVGEIRCDASVTVLRDPYGLVPGDAVLAWSFLRDIPVVATSRGFLVLGPEATFWDLSVSTPAIDLVEAKFSPGATVTTSRDGRIFAWNIREDDVPELLWKRAAYEPEFWAPWEQCPRAAADPVFITPWLRCTVRDRVATCVLTDEETDGTVVWSHEPALRVDWDPTQGILGVTDECGVKLYDFSPWMFEI